MTTTIDMETLMDLIAHPVIDVELLYKDAILGDYATDGSVAIDLHAYDPMLASRPQQTIALFPGETILVGTGIKVAIPRYYEGQVRPRSGNAANANLIVANSPGTIDSDYRGEIKVILHRLRYTTLKDTVQAGMPFNISQGDRIAQLVISLAIKAKFIPVKTLDRTERGEDGIGSTGKGKYTEKTLQRMGGSAPKVPSVLTPNLPPANPEIALTNSRLKQIDPIYHAVFRALRPDQKSKLFSDPLILQVEKVLSQVDDLQDRSEWDVPANSNGPQRLTYAEAFDELFNKDDNS